MITTRNLRWLIRAHLAKRGGHRSQMRIAPGAAPGYIDALRETNLAGDGKGRTKPVQIWKPKGGDPVHEHTDGEVSLMAADSNPAVGAVPADFQDIGYTALEGKLEQLVRSTDSWAEMDKPDQLIPWRDRSLLTSRQSALEAWRDQAHPRIDSSIEPWVVHFMDNSHLPFSIDLLKDS